MLLKVSSNEPSWVGKSLSNLGHGVEVCHLVTGDIIEETNNVAIERKHWRDFVSSMFDGRLEAQRQRLSTFDWPFVIIQGQFPHVGRSNVLIPRGGKAKPVNWQVVQATILSLQARSDIIVIQTPQPRAEFAKGVELALSYAASAPRAKVKKQRKGHVSLDGRVNWLCGLRGIGPVTAKNIMDYFNNDVALALKNVAVWGSVPGVGRKTVETVERFLRDGKW